MTAKETFIEAMRAAGYDFVSACEKYELAAAEFRKSGLKRQRYGVMQRGRCVRILEFRRLRAV